MKMAKRNARELEAKAGQKLKFRAIGKGFISRQPGPDVMAGMRLTTTYADQFERRYIQIDGSYELITEAHSFLAAD